MSRFNIMSLDGSSIVGRPKTLKNGLLKAGSMIKNKPGEWFIVNDTVKDVSYWPLSEGDTHLGWETDEGDELEEFNLKYFVSEIAEFDSRHP